MSRLPLPTGAPHRPYTLCPDDHGLLVDDVWPTIYFGAERLAEIRRKVDRVPWAARLYEQLRAEAELVLADEPHQPVERIGWRHQFYSKTTGEHLVYDPASPDAFLDPRTGERVTGEPEHAAWVLLTHERTHRRMRSLALLFALTGDPRCAAWVREGLLRAVEYFRHDEFREGNRTSALYFQPLYDGPVLTQLVFAYDLTRGADCYSPDDHEAIVNGIFERGMPYQLEFLDVIGVHNMACYVSAAVATCGHLLGRPEWVERGLRDPQVGLANLLRDGVRDGADGVPDGFWYEGTMFYHHYSVCPMFTLLELARTLGDPLGEDADVHRRLVAALTAPLRLADLDDRLPTIGDLGCPTVMRLDTYRHLFEYGAGRLDPALAGPLARLTARCGARDGWTALAFGPDELPAPSPPEQHHVLLPRPGIATFRDPAAAWYVLFKVGPHGTGHDHRDKLELALHAHGRAIAPDVGTAGYSLGEFHNQFYRGTLAHSTLLVDETGQAEVRDATVDWRPAARPAYAAGTVRDAYPGVTLRRQVWFDPPYLVVLDACDAAAEHRYGWLFHAHGELVAAVAAPLADLGLPPLPETAPWTWYTGRQSWGSNGLAEARWRVAEGLRLRLLAISDGPFELTAGRTPGQPLPDDRGTVLLRAAGASRRFAAVFEVTTAGWQATGLQFDGQGVVVATAAGPRRYEA